MQYRLYARTVARIFAIAIIPTGCDDGFGLPTRACDPSAPLVLSAEQRTALRPIDANARPDAQWADLARTAPGGFGGAYFEAMPHNQAGQAMRPPRVVIRLAHPEQRDSALHALLPRLPATFGGLAIDTADVLIVPAKWDFAQLDEWRRFLDSRIRSAGITSVDTDEASNQIRYGVRDAAARTNLERQLRNLGVPCGLVAIDVVDTAYPTPA